MTGRKAPKQTTPVYEQPDVWEDERTGELLTGCCCTAPVLYKSGRALCITCDRYFVTNGGFVTMYPKLLSVSRADSFAAAASKEGPSVVRTHRQLKDVKQPDPLPGQICLLD